MTPNICKIKVIETVHSQISSWQKYVFFTQAKLVFMSTGYYLIKTLIMVYCFSNYLLK